MRNKEVEDSRHRVFFCNIKNERNKHKQQKQTQIVETNTKNRNKHKEQKQTEPQVLQRSTVSKVLSTREGTGDDDDGFVRGNSFVRINREKERERETGRKRERERERGLRTAPASVKQREFTNTNERARNNTLGSTLQGE